MQFSVPKLAAHSRQLEAGSAPFRDSDPLKSIRFQGMIPELLSPAGSLDAVRAAVANCANAIYLGASQFNARDEGAQLSLEELAEACTIAHAGNARIYLTFNVLIKTSELEDALRYLGQC